MLGTVVWKHDEALTVIGNVMGNSEVEATQNSVVREVAGVNERLKRGQR